MCLCASARLRMNDSWIGTLLVGTGVSQPHHILHPTRNPCPSSPTTPLLLIGSFAFFQFCNDGVILNVLAFDVEVIVITNNVIVITVLPKFSWLTIPCCFEVV